MDDARREPAWRLPEQETEDFDERAFEEALRRHRRLAFSALEQLN